MSMRQKYLGNIQRQYKIKYFSQTILTANTNYNISTQICIWSKISCKSHERGKQRCDYVNWLKNTFSWGFPGRLH